MIKLEVIRNSVTEVITMDVDSLDAEQITQKLRQLPNFHPKLTGMFHEENQTGSHSILILKYTNSRKLKDNVLVRIIPMFAIMEAISSRLSA